MHSRDKFLQICHEVDKTEAFQGPSQMMSDFRFMIGMIDSLEQEVACLRSVLSEWDQDKSYYSQWLEANRIQDERDSADV